MINVKDAVGIAIQYLTDMYSTTSISDILLEEVELTEDKNWWLVTIGFSRPIPPDETVQNPLANAVFGQKSQSRRIYKIFEIDASNGEVRSMKIREP